MTENRSLMSIHPRRLDVPVLILASAGLLITAYFLPTLELTRIIFFTDTYSIWGGIVELWKGEHYILSMIVFVFSMVFPVAKLIGLVLIWSAPLDVDQRNRAADWIGQIGKWSMVDVYVVATLVVLIKARDLADANARIGIYLFAAAIVLSMIASTIVERVARKVDPV